MPVFDAIYKSNRFDFVLSRHEQGAGHMAQGYARVSGKTGVVLVTSGPGATNLITPLQDALSDGTPLVAFCGQVATSVLGTDAFQEADIVGISRPCTKASIMVKNVEELPLRMKEAFKIAAHGRPGPVLIELPKDVQESILQGCISTSDCVPDSYPGSKADISSDPDISLDPDIIPYSDSDISLYSDSDFSPYSDSDFSPFSNVSSGSDYGFPSITDSCLERNGEGSFVSGQAENDLALRRVARLINLAKKPLLFVGQGMLSLPSTTILKELADKAWIPVATTLQGLGAFDELDEKSLHMVGMHGSGYANLAMQEADLIIALGARFDDRVTGNLAYFAAKAKEAALEGRGGIVHFEILPSNINKRVEVTEAIHGDAAANLQLLLPYVNRVLRNEWFDQIQAWKDKFPFDYPEAGPEELPMPQAAIEMLCKLTVKEKTIITTGVGQHQMWAAQHFRWRYPKTMITSGGLGTMGFGLPAAIGAQVAAPYKTVVNIDGDASFQMTATELAVASQFAIPIKVVILNNQEQGMVAQWQALFYRNRFSHSHHSNVDFVMLAESMGVQADKCEKSKDLETKLNWLLDTPGPALLEVVTDSKVGLYPMVPPGKALHEFLAYDPGRSFLSQIIMLIS